MFVELGRVEAIFRYPIKSMRGQPLEAAEMGWHGIEGDRRFALRRMDDRGGFPWLTASKLPDLIRYTPVGERDDLPTHVRNPEGEELPVLSEELAAEIQRRYGAPVQMMHMRHGIFDDASLSVIALDTVNDITRLAGVPSDVRRFRPNIVVRSLQSLAFQEDEWLGGLLSFGEGQDTPAIAVTMHDIRCSMVNLDPDSAKPNPEVLKAAVRVNQNQAGIYGTVVRTGRVRVGQRLFLRRANAKSEHP